MHSLTRNTLDHILQKNTEQPGGTPGIVAMVTNQTGNIYEGCAGVRELGKPQPMSLDTVFGIFSCTKALTATVAWQLIEEGLLGLDDLARKYIPELANIQVLEGFDPAGQPILRLAKNEITIRHLMLHTAGFGYEFFSEKLLQCLQAQEVPTIISCTKAALHAPLLFDPGQRWEYGINIDWLGQIVETIRGKRLGEIMHERLFTPLDMMDSAFTMTPACLAKRATIHQRSPENEMVPQPELMLPQPPEVDMGGHGLYATVGDYMKFIRMILNDGAGSHGRVLKPETVSAMCTNGLGLLKISGFKTSIPELSNDAEFFPGLSKSWSYSFMVNDEIAPTGRPAGTIGWAGLANLFYWIDRREKIGGFWASQILPFGDPASFGGYMDFEKAVYQSIA